VGFLELIRRRGVFVGHAVAPGVQQQMPASTPRDQSRRIDHFGYSPAMLKKTLRWAERCDVEVAGGWRGAEVGHLGIEPAVLEREEGLHAPSR
jgi:hypothetical protein